MRNLWWLRFFVAAFDDSNGDGDTTETPETSNTPENKETSETKPPRTFTQEDVNKLLADNKRELRRQNEKMAKELEQLKKHAVSAEHKAQLERQIEELRQQHLSAEEKARLEQKKLKEKYQNELKNATEKSQYWENRYRNETIERSIIDGAIANDAYAPNQLVAILRPYTQLEEIQSEDGSTINFVAKVKLPSKNSDGEPVVLDFTVEEAIKYMKEDLPTYGNLFKSNITGGIGGYNQPGSDGKIDYKKLVQTPEKYMEMRKKQEIR